MSEDAHDWPPPWPEALEEEREKLGFVLRQLGVI
jgi:hypothetical protein